MADAALAITDLAEVALHLGEAIPDHRRYAALVRRAGLTPEPESFSSPASAYWSTTLFASRDDNDAIAKLLTLVRERRPGLAPIEQALATLGVPAETEEAGDSA